MPDINFPADGWGKQSRYYDEDLLFNGSYQLISITLHRDSRDTTHTPTTTLRKGLLLAKRAIDGLYEPLNTSDGYLNGVLPSHFMKDVVVLAEEIKMLTVQIRGINKLLSEAVDIVTGAYWSANIKPGKYYYNNSASVELTEGQLFLFRHRILFVSNTVKPLATPSGELRVLPGVQNLKETIL